VKQYDIDIEYSYGTGYYDGEEYSDIRVRENKNGDWVKAVDARKEIDKLKHRIKRMQNRLDKLEGRNV
jgi:hypothetical protein